MNVDRWRVSRAVLLAAAVVALSTAGVSAADRNPDALWDIVDGSCVPDQERHGDPAPCAQVDLSAGVEKGFAVLKDLVGQTQFLLIPTRRIEGIESPAILAPDATNYFAAAWRARTFVDERAGAPVPRDWVSLAINSEDARTQDQLHIHVDCISADVHDALTAHAAEVGSAWAPFPVPLAGHDYQAIAVSGEDLDGANPFTLVADGIPGARADMGEQTVVVVGTQRVDGTPGFVILTDRVDIAGGDTAGGEALQDHNVCAPASVDDAPAFTKGK